jgi:undecaprenyl-diphosphatase
VSGEQPSVSQAVALGLIQGPAELLPISSSSHTALIPWLMRWRSSSLDVEQRRSLEVALHAGTAAALVVGGAASLPRGRPRALTMLFATAPPAAAGYVLERFIDRRLSSPLPIALGLMLGAGCMAVADRESGRERRAEDAGAVDGLMLGAAQVLALAPGVSRNGATLAVARARGFGRSEADLLSWQVGVPVIAGAAALKLARARHRPAGARGTVLAGAASAFISTAASARAIAAARAAVGSRAADRAHAGGSPTGRLAPYAAYRLALALVVMRRLRQERSLGSSGRRRAPGASARRRAA